MIFFEEDYLKQKAFIHYSTRNKSAIYMAKVLKKMGIKNNKFHLALTQRELENVDPYDPNLSEEIRERIVYECKINPWYYFREVIKVSSQGADNGVPFEFNRANLALIWLTYLCIDVMLVIPRQCGKTTCVQSIVSHLMYIAGRSYTIGHFAKDQSLVQQNVIRLKEIRDSIPGYMVFKSIRDVDNKEGLDYKALKTAFKTFVAQTDRRAAARQARGESLSLTHHDEPAWYPNIDVSFPASTGSLGAARVQSKKSGLPSCSLLTTTAGRLDDPAGDWSYKYMINSYRFHESLYDCKDEKELKDITNNAPVYCEFSYKQLDRTEEWFIENTRGKDPDTVAMDYLNKWLSGKIGKALPTEMLEALIIEEPSYYEQKGNFVLRWYVTQEERFSPAFLAKSFIAGLDFGENVGRDFTTFTMIDVETLKVVCTLRSNTANLVPFAICIVDLIKTFNRLLIVPERNNNGSAVIDNMIVLLTNSGINPFKVIFNTYVQNAAENQSFMLDRLDPMGTDRKYLGFRTGANTRETMYSSVLVLAVQQCLDKIYDGVIINELKGLEVRNNRIDHAIGAHDDQVISWLLAMYVIYNGKNLSSYCIDTSSIMRACDASGKTVDPWEKEEQIRIRAKIQELESKLKMASPYLHDSIESEINNLKMKIKDHITIEEDKQSRIQIEKGERMREQQNTMQFHESVRQFNNLFNIFTQSF